MRFLQASFIALLSFFTWQVNAQQTPAAPQSEPILLLGGVAHLGNGKVIENSAIAFEDGKITMVADATVIRIDGDRYRVMNIHGKHVYPALIAPYTTIGLNEVAAVRATNDYQEVGKFNPNVRSLIAYNTDSKVIPTVRSNGVLFAQVIPKGGTVTGTSSIMAMDGWNWEDAVYKADDAIHMNWPSLHVNHGWWGEPQEDKANDQYKKSTDEIRTFFKEARAYNEVETHTTKNLKFEAMRGLFDGSKKLFIRANDAKQIMGAVNFCKEFELQGVIVGGRDSWMITDLLVENEIPVILERVHNLPPKSDDDIDLPFRLPKMLQDAGVQYCLTVGSGWDGFWDQRNLPFHAGTAAAYGLTKEEALAAITSNAAEILGISEVCGTLENRKDANIIVSSGDVLDMRTSNIEMAFIQGMEIDLHNKQKGLYKKFVKKYELE